jgi:hypothetical protein
MIKIFSFAIVFLIFIPIIFISLAMMFSESKDNRRMK